LNTTISIGLSSSGGVKSNTGCLGRGASLEANADAHWPSSDFGCSENAALSGSSGDNTAACSTRFALWVTPTEMIAQPSSDFGRDLRRLLLRTRSPADVLLDAHTDNLAAVPRHLFGLI
jgi:hypothetical protein